MAIIEECFTRKFEESLTRNIEESFTGKEYKGNYYPGKM
jgi:hypothetical protein